MIIQIKFHEESMMALESLVLQKIKSLECDITKDDLEEDIAMKEALIRKIQCEWREMKNNLTYSSFDKMEHHIQLIIG